MDTKRGRVLRDTNAGPGLATVGGRQYSFTLEDMWVSDIPPRPGMVVEVTFSGDGVPISLRAVPESELAREEASQALAGARRQGAEWTSGLRARLGVPVILAEALLLISFFLMPCLRMGNGFADRSLNGWDTLGLDPVSAATTSHGLLTLLALALLAPLSVPFVHKVWSRWLYAAPFAFAAIAFASVYFEIEETGRTAQHAVSGLLGEGVANQFGSPMAGMYSPAVGSFLVLLCSLYLLTRAFKRTSLTAFAPATLAEPGGTRQP